MNHFIEVEKNYINFSNQNKIYSFERDYIKPRYFIVPSRVIMDYYGLSIASARELINLDFIARYKRFLGYNVNFKLFYDDYAIESLIASAKLNMPTSKFIYDNIKVYKEEIEALDISNDHKNSVYSSDVDFTNYVDEFFITLFKKGLVKREFKRLSYSDAKVYQETEYKTEFDDSYTLDGRLINSVKKQIFSIAISEIKKEIKDIINSLKTDDITKEKIDKFFNYKYGYKIKLMASNGEYVETYVKDISYLTGLECIVIFKDGIKGIEPADYTVHSRIVGKDIPVYYSSYFQDSIHACIPSFDYNDQVFLSNNHLEFDDIISSFGSKTILINSGFLNGYSLSDAKEKIKDILENNNEIEVFENMGLDEVIISSPYKFGIPIPLNNDLSISQFPLTFDIKHDCKMVNGSLAERCVVSDFFNQDFINALRVNALRIKEEIGIDDLFTYNNYYINQMSNVNMLVERKNNISELCFVIIVNALFKHYFIDDLNYQISNMNYNEIEVDKAFQELKRENNNIVSISDIVNNFGATTLRLYFAINQDNVFDTKKLNDLFAVIDEMYLKILNVRIVNDDGLLLDSNQFVLNNNKYLKDNDFKSLVLSIYEYTKKVLIKNEISKKHFKDYLIYLSIITPAIADRLKDIIGIKDDVSYLDFPM